MNRPWWMDGVPFACQPDCGRCCDEPGGIVYLRPEDAQNLANHHDMSVEDWLERDCRQTLDGRYILNSDQYTDVCIYLDENKNAQFINHVQHNANHIHSGQKMSGLTGVGNVP